ncbi:uncharacterized protein, YigZ family [Peptoclostridium litorale DSM 5388]|uniref:IMPACT family protein n=1 Tax=Peptoclostridium litorale DSM 5388 TaxID=1121324 RepID=A0A069RPH7_PEPLI|nr:YigZ family protein [Peptoclostridium litorale]KDR96072.1 IMPACT family protein [Peptoclostridium litorale DSM 5388]SIO05327.1 uncharacterized protein, YigZ family [Peptoclostridium litorale DSM 5388]
MELEYRTVHEFGSDEVIIEKSRFIGYSKPVENEEDAIGFIEEIKQKHKDATHNVWAYTVGMSMNIQRYSDDGEPKGTAGIPVLEVIKKEDLRNVAVVVTRYFGGTKLGAGGLVRAYTRGAKIGLDAAKIAAKHLYTKLFVQIEYTMLGKIQNEFANKGYIIKDIEYGENVKLTVYSPLEIKEEIEEFVKEITSANADITRGEDFYLSVIGTEVILE